VKDHPTLSLVLERGGLGDHGELIIDLFAGGGGASCGLEMALGRSPDIAVNHHPAAVALHARNHPNTKHYTSDVFEIDPRSVTEGRPVGFLWASPDCTYHSKARGQAPIRSGKKKRRALAWVVTRWAGQVKPRVIMLENVEEFEDWGPLVGKPDQLRPCKRRRGRTFRAWVRSLKRHGYVVEWRELRACAYGAPTIRKRLYLIARCDGQPIVWPESTHADPKAPGFEEGGKKPFRIAGECIDWDEPMLSIFATKEEAQSWGREQKRPAPIRPLAEKTMRRIARGVMRYVVKNPTPYIVGVGGRQGQSPERSTDSPLQTVTAKGDSAVVAPTLTPVTHGNLDRRTPPADEPFQTVTCAQRGELAVVATELAPFSVPRYGEREGQEPRARSLEEPGATVVNSGNGDQLVAAQLATYHDEKGAEVRGSGLDVPTPTVDTENRHALVTSFLAQNNGGFAEGNTGDGKPLDVPTTTSTGKGANQSLVSLFLDQNNNGFDNRSGRPIDEPNGAVCANGSRQTLIAANMVQSNYGEKPFSGADEPGRTIVAGGTHHAVCATHLQQDYGQSVGYPSDEPIRAVTSGGGGHSNLIASFLAKYYGEGTGQVVSDPIHTIPTVDRFGLVNVTVNGQTYYIADIAMRMLKPRELYRAQGFPDSYIIDQGADGQKITATEQVRMCGNSVSPPVAAALVGANVPELIIRERAA